MGTTALIGLGIVAWVVLAVLVALLTARVISLRNRQRPDRTGPGTPVDGEPADDAEPAVLRRRRQLRLVRTVSQPPAADPRRGPR